MPPPDHPHRAKRRRSSILIVVRNHPDCRATFGITRAAAEVGSANIPTVAEVNGKKCWYVLDVQLCD